MPGLRPSDRLRALGLTLPAVPEPLAAYVPAVRSGALVFTAGQLPLVDGSLAASGLVGDDVSVEQAAAHAQTCALNALAAAAALLPEGLDGIGRVVKVVGYVAGAPGFAGQPAVLNGASTLLGQLFAGTGGHARSAVAVAALPLGAPVEVELVVEVVAEAPAPEQPGPGPEATVS